MEQYRFNSTIFREFGQTSGKFFARLCRHKTHCLKVQTENMVQTVYKSVAMFWAHSETGAMILLQRVVFQIHKNKEKAFRDIRQGAVLVDTEATTATSPFAIQLIFRQIIIMSRLKRGKQMQKLNMGQTCQGTETLGIFFMLFIIHATKIHAYTIYI